MSKKSYPVRIPRYAPGIRAQESRAIAGNDWWGREWMRRLEAMGLKGRLGRGKKYALSGQVVTMEIAGGTAKAVVQGTRTDPYQVTISFRQVEAKARRAIVRALRAEPMLVARLLAGVMPLQVGEIFRAAGAELFPGGKLGPGRYDMTTTCNCPDYANPCKHSMAALLILGEEIAHRPATLLALRGIAMEELYDEA